MKKSLNTNYHSIKLGILFLFTTSGYASYLKVSNIEAQIIEEPNVKASNIDISVVDSSYIKASFIHEGQHSGRYVKIDGSGVELAHDADQWKCVKDSETNLVWEVKTTYSRSYWNSRYTNTSNLLSGEIPTTARGTCLWSTEQQMLIEDESCHTQGYVDHINGLTLCGYTDWRMPSELELRRVLPIRENNSYDSAYFPFNYPQQGMLNFWVNDNFPPNKGKAKKVRLFKGTSLSPRLHYPRPSPVLVPNVTAENAVRINPVAVRLVRGN